MHNKTQSETGRCDSLPLQWRPITAVERDMHQHLYHHACHELRRKTRSRCRRVQMAELRGTLEPLAVETAGMLGPAFHKILQELGRRITAKTGNTQEPCWLRQRVSLTMVRGNAAAITNHPQTLEPNTLNLSPPTPPHTHTYFKFRTGWG